MHSITSICGGHRNSSNRGTPYLLKDSSRMVEAMSHITRTMKSKKSTTGTVFMSPPGCMFLQRPIQQFLYYVASMRSVLHCILGGSAKSLTGLHRVQGQLATPDRPGNCVRLWNANGTPILGRNGRTPSARPKWT